VRFIRKAALTGGLLLGSLVLAAPALAAPSEQDTTWMVAAHQSNLAEIAAGQAAQQRATTDTVRRLGQMFIDMHTQLDAELTAAAGQLGVQLPGSPTQQQQQELAAVTANQGQAFDTAWIAQQLTAHRRSAAAGEQELARGSDPTVLQLARAAAPVIQQHLNELRAAADQYGVPTSVPGGTGGQVAGSTRTTGVLVAVTGALLVALSAVALLWSRRRA
jgi:putative membrane protein